MCERVVIPGGGYAIVCRGRARSGHGGRARMCSKCGTRTATKLCDGELAPVRPGEKGRPATCDKRLCDLCAHVRGTGDYCDDCVDRRPKLAL